MRLGFKRLSDPPIDEVPTLSVAAEVNAYIEDPGARGISEYIAHAVREWINMEAEEPKDARDFIAQELKPNTTIGEDLEIERGEEGLQTTD